MTVVLKDNAGSFKRVSENVLSGPGRLNNHMQNYVIVIAGLDR